MYRQSVLAILLTILGTGCVSTRNVPVDHQALTALRGKNAAVSLREKPDFDAVTSGKSMLGAVGGAMMLSAGNKIAHDHALEDPAVYIGHKLLADISAQNSLTALELTDPAMLANVDLLIDVETIYWGLAHFPRDWAHYRVIYSAKLRLVDTKREKFIAAGFCERVPEEKPDAPTYDELLQNDADRLKKELTAAADFCIGEFRAKVLPHFENNL
jgi:hypothetical protein